MFMNIIKKTILFLFTIIIAVIGISSTADAAKRNSDKLTPYQFATDFLTEYYNAVDIYEAYDFEKYIQSSQLLEYVNGKIEAKRSKSIVYGTNDIRNYKLVFTLKDSEINDSHIKLSIIVEAKFNYRNACFDSAYGEISQIIISDNNGCYSVEDWYAPLDPYDIQLRGESNSIDDLKPWSNDKRTENNLKQKQEKINEDIEQYYKKINEELNSTDNTYTDLKETVIGSSRLKALASLRSLDRSAMVTWANNNCDKENPSSGNSSQVSTYYDFSKIANSYDCTNFVSHSLLAGGAVIYDTGSSGITSQGWYYRNNNNRSESWTLVNKLYNFLTTNTTKGPSGSYCGYTNIYAPSGNNPYKYGDILQFHNGSTWRHSTLITGYTYIEGSTTTLEAIVTGRTSPGVYNKNQRQLTIYPGNQRRVIKMLGYYN